MGRKPLSLALSAGILLICSTAILWAIRDRWLVSPQTARPERSSSVPVNQAPLVCSGNPLTCHRDRSIAFKQDLNSDGVADQMVLVELYTGEGGEPTGTCQYNLRISNADDSLWLGREGFSCDMPPWYSEFFGIIFSNRHGTLFKIVDSEGDSISNEIYAATRSGLRLALTASSGDAKYDPVGDREAASAWLEREQVHGMVYAMEFTLNGNEVRLSYSDFKCKAGREIQGVKFQLDTETFAFKDTGERTCLAFKTEDYDPCEGDFCPSRFGNVPSAAAGSEETTPTPAGSAKPTTP